MKKIIILLLIITSMFSISGQGYCSEHQKNNDKEFVEKLNLLPETEENYVSRNTMLYTAVNMVAKDYYEEFSADETSPFADLDANDSMYKIADFALHRGIFNGRYSVDGKILADLNSEATWKEILIVSLRCLNSKLEPLSDEKIRWYASELGLDDFKVERNNEIFKITDVLDEKVEYDEYCSFINEVLHTPYISYTYGGELTKYLIDGFINSEK